MEKNVTASRVKELRKEQRYSQGDIAELLKINRSTVSSIENGTREANRKHLTKYAEFFKVNLEWLLGLTDKRKKS